MFLIIQFLVVNVFRSISVVVFLLVNSFVFFLFCSLARPLSIRRAISFGVFGGDGFFNMNGTISPVALQTLHLLRSQTVLANNHFGKIINFNVLQVCKLQKWKFSVRSHCNVQIYFLFALVFFSVLLLLMLLCILLYHRGRWWCRCANNDITMLLVVVWIVFLFVLYLFIYLFIVFFCLSFFFLISRLVATFLFSLSLP